MSADFLFRTIPYVTENGDPYAFSGESIDYPPPKNNSQGISVTETNPPTTLESCNPNHKSIMTSAILLQAQKESHRDLKPFTGDLS